MLHGVDVHCDYQAGLNIELLARQGYAFCCVKATEGTAGYTAPAMFNDWITRTRQAGMVPGAYHWLNASNPVNQAHHFLSRLDQVGGPAGLLLQIDCEDTTSPATPDTVSGFVAELNRATGRHPLLFYTGAWWYGPHLGSFRAVDLDLLSWHSHYLTATHGDRNTLAPLVPATWWTPGYGGFTRATCLQYTSRGDAGGLAANVDLNLFDGTTSQLRALTGADPYQRDEDMLKIAIVNGRYYVGDGLTRRLIIDWPEHQALVAAGATETDYGTNEWDAWGAVGRIDMDALNATVGVLSTAVQAIAAKVDIDAGELAAIQQSAQTGAAAALATLAVDLAAQLKAAMLEAGHEVDDAAVEAAVRRVFADAATPDTPPAAAPQG